MAPHGGEPGTLFQALLDSQSAIQPIFPDLPKPAAAATVAFDETRWFTKLQLAGVDRVSQLAVAAAAGLGRSGKMGWMADWPSSRAWNSAPGSPPCGAMTPSPVTQTSWFTLSSRP